MSESLIGNLAAILSMETSAFEEGATHAQRLMRQTQRQFQQMGQQITAVGARLSIAITAPLVAFGAHAARTAMDAQELQSAFNTTFGALSDEMNTWAQRTGVALGRSTRELQEGANAFGLYFNQSARTREEAARLSQQFTVLAQDLSSFHNTTVDEALLALRSGLSGETEPLRRYGVFLNEAAVAAEATRMGLVKVNGAFTDQQKVMARANLILRATANAQGDVLRTSGSTANQLRRAQAAWENLSITVGTRLLPVLTPLIVKVADLLDRFAQLSPAVQTFVVGTAAAAAVLGPVLMGMGQIVAFAGTLLPLVVRLAGAFVTLGGAGGTVATGLGIALRFLGPIAAAASAAYLVWKNWDSIAPILQRVGSALDEAFGPTVRQVIATLTEAVSSLWNGPLGELIRQVPTGLAQVGQAFGALFDVVGPWLGRLLSELGQLALAFASVFGPVVISLLRGFLSTAAGVFQLIADAINLVTAVLRGDFSGAWNAAKTLVVNVVRNIGNIIEAMVPGAIGALRRLYEGAREWLVNKFNDLVELVMRPIRAIESGFAWLYDRVVGNSWVPDMVDEIGQNIARLQGNMVVPVQRMTGEVSGAFEGLQQLLDRLFPENARLRQYRTELRDLTDALESGAIDAETFRKGVEALNGELGTADTGSVPATRMQQFLETLPLTAARVRESLEEVAIKGFGAISDQLADAVVGAQSLGQAFKNIARQIIADLARIAIQRAIIGPLTNALGGLFGGGDKLGGILGKRAAGGPVFPGGTYLVGEKGPELLSMGGARGYVTPNSALQGMGSATRIIIEPSPLFDVKMSQSEDRAAARGAAGGQAMTMQSLRRASGRRMGRGG